MIQETLGRREKKDPEDYKAQLVVKDLWVTRGTVGYQGILEPQERRGR